MNDDEICNRIVLNQRPHDWCHGTLSWRGGRGGARTPDLTDVNRAF